MTLAFFVRQAEPVLAPPAQTSTSYPEIHPEDLSAPDARRSRSVSSQEFQGLAAEGEKRYNRLNSINLDTSALDENMPGLTKSAYQQTRQPWGGATINANTGVPLAGNEDMYALTVKQPGMETVSTPIDSSQEDFTKAMTSARQKFAPLLSHPGRHLGVFRDDDKGTVDFDPVHVTRNYNDVETIGAYTRAVGGAYHFKSGDGFWPPHVASAAPGQPRMAAKPSLEEYRRADGTIDWVEYKKAGEK